MLHCDGVGIKIPLYILFEINMYTLSHLFFSFLFSRQLKLKYCRPSATACVYNGNLKDRGNRTHEKLSDTVVHFRFLPEINRLLDSQIEERGGESAPKIIAWCDRIVREN